MGRERRYCAVGGAAAWPVPLAAGFLATVAGLLGDWTLSCLPLAAGVIGWTLQRAVVLDVSPSGLGRGLALGAAFVGPVRILAWPAIDEITTRWQRPRDFTGLETVVTARRVGTIRFTSRMGLTEYRDLVAEVARRAPHAHRRGLTDQLLREVRPPRRRRVGRLGLAVAGGACGVLALLVVLALLG